MYLLKMAVPSIMYSYILKYCMVLVIGVFFIFSLQITEFLSKELPVLPVFSMPV